MRVGPGGDTQSIPPVPSILIEPPDTQSFRLTILQYIQNTGTQPTGTQPTHTFKTRD